MIDQMRMKRSHNDPFLCSLSLGNSKFVSSLCKSSFRSFCLYIFRVTQQFATVPADPVAIYCDQSLQWSGRPYRLPI